MICGSLAAVIVELEWIFHNILKGGGETKNLVIYDRWFVSLVR
jgi:hypothetical protein